MRYELWELSTGNLVGAYETEAAALRAVAEAIRRYGPAAPAAESCTGTAVGRLVLPDGSAAAGEWVQLAGKGARVAADGGFRVDGVPIGRHNGVARHARFAFVLAGCGQVVDLGAIEYP